MTEIYKDIKGYEGLYQVSNLGNVKSLNYNKTGKEKTLIPHITGSGYLSISLGRKYRQYIHRLVAEAFIPNPNNLETVNHKDENKQNNSVQNLEWMTNKENVQYSKATKIKCLDLKTKEITYYSSIRDTAKSFHTIHRAILYSLHKAKIPYKNRYIFSEIKNEED